MTVVSFFANGAVIRRDEMDWELIFPLISVSPPLILPLPIIVIGSLWSLPCPEIFIPQERKAFIIVVLGRLRNVFSPVTIISPLHNGRRDNINRRSVPDSPTFINPFCKRGTLLNPLISRYPSSFRTTAPMASNTLIVAMVSSEYKGFIIRASPFILPIIIALCV